MKQTVVEFLIDQLEQKGEASVNVSIGRMQISIKEKDYNNLIDQAKEMQEQQIKTAYGSGIETMRKSFSINSHIPKGAQEYYNDTFNK